MERRSKYKRDHTEHRMMIGPLDLGRRRKELHSPAPAHNLRDDDEDEAGCDDGSLYAEGHSSAGLGYPLRLEVSDAETTCTMSVNSWGDSEGKGTYQSFSKSSTRHLPTQHDEGRCPIGKR